MLKFDRIETMALLNWGFSFLFMPECQINYFISTINLFYVGEITDSDDIYCPGLSIEYKKRRITCNSLIPVADLFV